MRYRISSYLVRLVWLHAYRFRQSTAAGAGDGVKIRWNGRPLASESRARRVLCVLPRLLGRLPPAYFVLGGVLDGPWRRTAADGRTQPATRGREPNRTPASSVQRHTDDPRTPTPISFTADGCITRTTQPALSLASRRCV